MNLKKSHILMVKSKASVKIRSQRVYSIFTGTYGEYDMTKSFEKAGLS